MFVLPVACVAALAPATAAADPGATLTVPAQVQARAGASPAVQPSFSYPETTPFCTVGVVFTWDGGSWLSEFPIKNGSLCVASGVNGVAPNGHGGAGSHQICGSAGPRYQDCKTVTIVVAAGSSVPASARPNVPAQSTAPGQSAPLLIPSNTPAPRIVTHAASRLPAPSREIGLALLAVGVLGLLLVVGRRLLLRRRRQHTPLPTPDGRR